MEINSDLKLKWMSTRADLLELYRLLQKEGYLSSHIKLVDFEKHFIIFNKREGRWKNVKNLSKETGEIKKGILKPKIEGFFQETFLKKNTPPNNEN